MRDWGTAGGGQWRAGWRAAALIGALCAALACGTASAQSATGPASEPAVAALTRASLLRAADLQADLAVLHQAYEALHPGLYRYNTPAEMAAQFARTQAYFTRDRSLGEAFLELTRLTAAVRCGHSYPNFSNQGKAVAGALFTGRDKLPFAFRWLDGRMVVTRDHSGAGLPAGTVVEAVNGVATPDILAALLPYARADGGNDAKRVAYLELRGQERYWAFDVLYPLLYPPAGEAFTLRVRRPGEAAATELTVGAFDLEQRRASMQAGDAATGASDKPAWTYEEHDGVGVVRMPTWALYNSKWDYKAWTQALFDDITARRLPHLVLDLRENEGGVDAGNAFLAHLITQPLTLPSYLRHVRYRATPAELNPVLDTWDKSFRDWGDSAVGPIPQGERAGFYRLTKWDDVQGGGNVLQPALPRFRGKVWVLVGPVNSSATFQFALTVKTSGAVTLVGQATGGNRRGINGGAFFFVRLPRTGLEVDLPLVGYYPEAAQPDAGVLPDIAVPTTATDIARGADVEMARVLTEAKAQGTAPAALARVFTPAQALGFSGVVMAGDADGVLFESASGLANRANGLPMRADMPWRWASVSKQLTAMAAATLVAQGRLQLDAPVAQYLGAVQFPSQASASITVRQLLQHTSGLPNPDDIPGFYTRAVSRSSVHAEPTRGLCAGPIKRPPGERFEYNNCDYLVLAAVLEQAAGQPYDRLVADRIAAPLGLASLRLAGDGEDGLVKGYADAQHDEPALNLATFGAAGAWVGTPRDLLALDQALMRDTLLPDAVKAQFWAGEPRLGYVALGVWSFPAALSGCAAPLQVVERRGEIGGVQVRNFILPAARKALIVFTNRGDWEFGEVWQRKGFSFDLLSALACP